jgi:regulator of sigma E protease
MEIIIFIVVLVVLILVHEIGHFIVAKLSGMRVDEFGIGYPPRALTLGKIGDTEYTLNWLPFGGFVRIFGEDGAPEDASEEASGDMLVPNTTPVEAPTKSRAFGSKPLILQALVLIAGIAMNLVFAYLLFTTTLIIGTQQELTQTQAHTVKDAVIVFTSVRPGSPADKAGFLPGDEIKNEEMITKAYGESYNGTDPAAFTTLIGIDTMGAPIRFTVDRNGKTLTLTATPATNTIPGEPSHPGIGVSVSAIGTLKTPILKAPYQGLVFTWNVTEETAVELVQFFKSVILFKANLNEVSGPVGIANAVGQASMNGISALVSLVGLISINLALINLLPIPALDGGRLLFVIIEAIIRRPLNPKIAERVNMVGFILLVLLMLVITGHDIYTLVKH